MCTLRISAYLGIQIEGANHSKNQENAPWLV